MNFEDTPCCAVTTIDDLSGHDTPEDAMKSFCRYFYTSYTKTVRDPGAFFVFTGVSKIDKKNTRCECSYDKDSAIGHNGDLMSRAEYCEYYSCDCERCHTGTKYGEKFAKFIRDNNLGRVTASKPVSNRLNHPSHLVRVWVWSPDVDTLNKWYQARREEKKNDDYY